MTNLVKYHSDINKIPLRNFNEKEINLFFSLLFKAKEEGIRKIKINFTDLRKISNGDINSPRFIKSLENLNYKLLNLNQKIILEDSKIVMFNLFNRFVIDPRNKDLEIQIGEDFYYMLNDFLTYTQFELKQLVRLRSSYSKNLFRLLKQFESTNFFSMYIDEFRRILCVPESYKMSEIDRTVIKPAIKELVPLFPNLKLEKIKEGRKVKTLKFTWGNKCELKEEKKSTVVKIEISERLNAAIEKAKKNRFIQPILTVTNIEKLIKKYSEDLLIKGLNFAKKEINLEIKSLAYLEKTIDTGIGNSEKKIVVKQKLTEEPMKLLKEEKVLNPIETREELNPVKEIEGTNISLEDFTEEEIDEAIERFSEETGTEKNFLINLRKRSIKSFTQTIKKHLEDFQGSNVKEKGIEKEADFKKEIENLKNICLENNDINSLSDLVNLKTLEDVKKYKDYYMYFKIK